MSGRFSLEAIFKALDQFSAPVAKMQSQAERFTKQMGRGFGKVNSVNDKISSGLQTAAASAAVLGVAGGAVLMNVGKAGADFDQAMANVGAVSLMTRSQVADLEKEAMRLGSSTKFSATEVAGAMELMGKAGFDNAQIMKTIPGVLNAAAAEGMELSEAASLISNTLKGMGLDVSETTRVADVLTLASARTNSSISSLGESMAILSSTARQFNVPLEDSVAAVAMLQDVGLDASTAGTAVSTMFTKMASPTKDVAQQMRAMGISFQDAHGNMLPFPDVMEQLVKAGTKAGGNMKQVAFFADLVGLRGQKAALNLKDLFKEGKVQALTKELRGAAGSAKQMADLRMNSFTGDMTLLGASVDAVKIDLFNLQSGPLRGVIQSMRLWIDANRGVIVQRVQDTIGKIKANLPEIVMWLKRIAFAIVVFYAFSTAVKVAQVATATFNLVLGLASLAGSAYSAAVWLARTVTMGLAVATDASVIAAIASTAWTWLQAASLFSLQVLIGAATAVKWLFVTATTASTYSTAANTIATWAGTAARTAWNAITAIATGIQALFTLETWTSAAATVALTVASWAITAAIAAFNFILLVSPIFILGAIIVGLIAYLIHLAGGWDFVKDKVVAFGAAVMSSISPVIDRVKSMIEWISHAGTVVGGFLGLGAGAGPGGGATPQVVSPQDRAAQSLSQEFSSSGFGEVTIKDTTGKAEITKAPTGGGFGLNLQPSGAF